MFFIRNLIWIFRLFQVLHFCPFSLAGKDCEPKVSWWFNVYSFVGIVLRGIVLLYTAIVCKFFISDFRAGITPTILSVMIGCVRSLELLIHLEAFSHRERHIQFLSKMNRVDWMLTQKLSVDMKYKKVKRDDYCVAVVWILFHFCMMFVVLQSTARNFNMMMISILYFQSFIGMSMHYFQVILYVQMLQYRLSLLNEILDRMSAYRATNFQVIDIRICQVVSQELGLRGHLTAAFDASSAEHVLNQMVLVREVYHELWELAESVNQLFKFSLPVSIGTDFVSMLSTIYWLFMHILVSIGKADQAEHLSGVACLAWASINGVHIFYLSKCCHNTQTKAQTIAIALHKVQINVVLFNDKLRNFFQHFSMQLLHQRIQFNAFGFFSIDYTLVFMVCKIGIYCFTT